MQRVNLYLIFYDFILINKRLVYTINTNTEEIQLLRIIFIYRVFFLKCDHLFKCFKIVYGTIIHFNCIYLDHTTIEKLNLRILFNVWFITFKKRDYIICMFQHLRIVYVIIISEIV